jgi:hypothetical protein
MALLSNINDKFAVDSTGAIQFNGQVGTSGYVLKSNANAAPTWVDPSTVIGGPYLPLTGGTLTGNLSISGSNSLTVGGALTGTTATFSGLVSGITPTAAANFATKAYVDAHPGSGGTVTSVTAGNGLAGGTITTTGTLSTVHLPSFDTRSTNPDPEDYANLIRFDFKSNSANGLSDGGTYNGQMTWRSYGSGSDLTGGQPIRLAYTANGNLWRQMGTSATSWGTWNKFAIGTGTTAQYIRGDASLATFPTIPPDPTGVYLPLAGGIMSGNIGRSAYNSGYQVGGYNNIGASHAKTNPIHVIGTSYEPTTTGLSNMYGIGYTRADVSFLSLAQGSGWGLYVASDGDARIFLDGSQGDIYATNKLCVNSYANQAGGLLFSAGQTTGTTRSLNLRTTNVTSDPSNSDGSNSTGITWGQRTDNNPYYIIKPTQLNFGGGNYSKLTLNWHTGIRIGGQKAYGGTKFYNDAPDIVGETGVIMNVGVGNDNIGVVNDLTVGVNAGIGTTVTTGGFNVNNANSGSYYNMSNADSGNFKYTNPNGRLLTSNGAGWVADGRDPILTLSSAGNSGATTVGYSVGLNLYSNTTADNTYSPLICFSNQSNSGNYATTYAAIGGKKTGQGVDSNWSTGELHFWTAGPAGAGSAAYMQQASAMMIDDAGSVGIGVTSPQYKLDVNGQIRAVGIVNIGGLGVAASGALANVDINDTDTNGTSTSYQSNITFKAAGVLKAQIGKLSNSTNYFTAAKNFDGPVNIIASEIHSGHTHNQEYIFGYEPANSGDTWGLNIVDTATTPNSIYIGAEGLHSTSSIFFGGYVNALLVTRISLNQTLGTWLYDCPDAGTSNVSVKWRKYNVGGYMANMIDFEDDGDIKNINGSYGTISSDERVKENIVDATPKLNDILSLKVRNFNFIGDNKKQIGLIAQEVEEIFPSWVNTRDTRIYKTHDEDGNPLKEQGELVSGHEDGKSLKVGMEFSILTKAIQEQQEIINDLKSRIETLENK